METIISAVVGELVTRSISFLINRYFLNPAPSKESKRRLQWMLMRIQVTVKEAEGRRITNQAMLQQLNMLREVMYRGYYMLDTKLRQKALEAEDYEHGASRFLSLSKFNPAKRVRFTSGSSKRPDIKEIEDMLECVETTITGMSEFVVFLRNYPPMFRQPYCTYLYVGNCMFGRQVEVERVINFLLYEEHPVYGNIGVLPIVGPRKVGKTTLVEHVCRDERVRNHFSRIVLLSDCKFREQSQCTFTAQDRIKHQNYEFNGDKNLVIVEVVGNFDESAWQRLLLAYQGSVPTISKIIIISRSKDIINFGTTQALSLDFLSQEAYWYFFKALLFGCAGSEEQSKLLSIAATMLDEYFDQGIYKPFIGPFIDLNNLANLLKDNAGARSWRKILECMRENRQQNQCISREILRTMPKDNGRIFFRRVTKATQYCVVDSHDRIGLDGEEDPNITMTDAISACVVPNGKFEVLAWKSNLPPYHRHIYSCEIFEFQSKVTKNNQGRKRKNLM